MTGKDKFLQNLTQNIKPLITIKPHTKKEQENLDGRLRALLEGKSEDVSVRIS